MKPDEPIDPRESLKKLDEILLKLKKDAKEETKIFKNLLFNMNPSSYAKYAIQDAFFENYGCHYIDYEEKIKNICCKMYGYVSFSLDEERSFHIWVQNMESEYRQSKGLLDQDIISPKEVYEFLVMLYYQKAMSPKEIYKTVLINCLINKGDRNHD
jgi:hypothetical protein